MSYQVLARKWRPQSFSEMVGQEHVLKALVNALDQGRLHHAYLFTGTRGVGKTTIARILAKCLNCETEVRSQPCGQCSACTEITEGRFIDLIEVDAASRTKVEDTRDLLDNVQYAPTRGRYKVYLIDEVHMLSTHSFNALLKTLEEPPSHVKFLLATTDPQKLPATILSRCLQFNLKNMTPQKIVTHLQYILEQEAVSFDEQALWLLSRAANGSVRDALSLTDQAISYGSGTLVEQQVRDMLGSIDSQAIFKISNALVAADAELLLDAVAALAEHAPDFAGALDALNSVLHRVAIAQAVPGSVDNSQGDKQQILAIAQQLAAEEVQLFYQMGLMGKRDLALAPDPRSGFEMALLRMLAFKPDGVAEPPTKSLADSNATQNQPAPPVSSVSAVQEGADTVKKFEAVVADAEQPVAATAVTELLTEPLDKPKQVILQQESALQLIPLAQADPSCWSQLFPQLVITGAAKNIASHCVMKSREDKQFEFDLEEAQATIYNDNHRQRFQDAMCKYFETEIALNITVTKVTAETPAQYIARIKAERLQQATDIIQQDANVKMLIDEFGGTLDMQSIVPIDG